MYEFVLLSWTGHERAMRRIDRLGKLTNYQFAVTREKSSEPGGKQIMARLTYSADEILADHPYAKPHVEAGYTLHGGFDAAGKYISPRTLNRWPRSMRGAKR
jgi:hypothetical protein